MKKLIVILLVVLSFAVDVNSQVVYSKIGFRHTDFVYYACERLRITDIDIVINYTDKQVEAYAFRYNEATYVIGISRKCKDVKAALAHEIYHIFQDIRTDFDINEGTFDMNTLTYKGRHSRQIENDANVNSRKILLEYGGFSRNKH